MKWTWDHHSRVVTIWLLASVLSLVPMNLIESDSIQFLPVSFLLGTFTGMVLGLAHTMEELDRREREKIKALLEEDIDDMPSGYGNEGISKKCPLNDVTNGGSK